MRSNKRKDRLDIFLGLILASTNLLADHNGSLLPLSFKGSLDKDQALDNQHCADDSDESEIEQLCHTKSNNEPIFDTTPILSISTQIDIRPENCQSFFDDYLHTRRGLRIESALNTVPIFKSYVETVHTFPVIDFINDSHAHIVKSKDLSSTIYSTNSFENRLYDNIIADAEEIQTRIIRPLLVKQSISAKVHGKSTIIQLGDLDKFTLHVVIQSGMATPDQIKQIRLAEEEIENRWGFTLKVIEIP